jgi:hypothetical protein
MPALHEPSVPLPTHARHNFVFPTRFTLSVLFSLEKSSSKLTRLGKAEKECSSARLCAAWRIGPGLELLQSLLAHSRVADMAHGGVAYIWTIAARAETHRRPSFKLAPQGLKRGRA